MAFNQPFAKAIVRAAHFGVRQLDAALYFVATNFACAAKLRAELSVFPLQTESGVEPPHSKGSAFIFRQALAKD